MLRLDGPVSLTVAGRTDAGVHARGQVAHADVPVTHWSAAAPAVLRLLAGILPPDVRVGRIGPAPEGFDARFAALSRRYSYRVCDDPARPVPLRRHDTLRYRRPLDVAAMNAAAALLLGEHDFAAFCRRREGASTVRALLQLSWAREPGVPGAAVTGAAVPGASARVAPGPDAPSPGAAVPGAAVPGAPAPGMPSPGVPSVVVGTVVADAFCHSMVRALTGALLKVGEGARPPEWPARVLRARVRDPGVPVVPPHGLCLEEVRYPPPGQLAGRARATRRLRGDPAGPEPTAEPA